MSIVSGVYIARKLHGTDFTISNRNIIYVDTFNVCESNSGQGLGMPMLCWLSWLIR